jgi:hypothetical protein
MFDINPAVYDNFMEWFAVGEARFRGFRSDIEEDQVGPGGAIYRTSIPHIIALVTDDFPDMQEGDTIERESTGETYTVPYTPDMGNIKQVAIRIKIG